MLTDMPLKYAVGDTLRKLRWSKGMNLTELSSKAHVSIGHISDIERGATSAGFEVIDALARGLDLNTSELVKEIYDYLEEVA